MPLIHEFTSTGVPVGQWGTIGTYTPGVAVDSLGNIFISESGGNNQIGKYTPSGILILKWPFGTPNQPPGRIAVGSSGNIFVTNQDYGYLKEFTPLGTFVNQWGNFGYSSLRDLAIGPCAENEKI